MQSLSPAWQCFPLPYGDTRSTWSPPCAAVFSPAVARAIISFISLVSSLSRITFAWCIKSEPLFQIFCRGFRFCRLSCKSGPLIYYFEPCFWYFFSLSIHHMKYSLRAPVWQICWWSTHICLDTLPFPPHRLALALHSHSRYLDLLRPQRAGEFLGIYFPHLTP